MKCWHCNDDVIWGADHDLDDNEDYVMYTSLSCPNCDSYYEIYFPRKEKTWQEVLADDPGNEIACLRAVKD